MTNVPEDIRAFWTELYKLFDVHFRMDTGSQEAWDSFWKDANALWEKSGKKDTYLGLISACADLLAKH